MRVPSFGRPFAVSNPRQVWLITAAHGVNEFYSVALPPILPLLVLDFDITYGQAGALLTVYYVMYSVFQLPAGSLADRVGQTKLLSAGMVVLGLGMAGAALAGDYLTLVLAQALAGIGGSTYHPAGMSLISDIETGTTEGRAMGIHGFGGVAGTALAPALIGGLAVAFDWRVALAFGAGVGVIYAAFFLVLFDDPTGSPGRAAAVETARDDPAESASGPGRSGAVARLRRAFNLPLTRWVGVLFVANLVINVEFGAIRTFTTSYLFARTAESASIANTVFFVMLLGGGLSSLGVGHLADRFDRTAIGVGALLLSAGALAATAALPAVPVLLLGWFFLLGVVLFAVFPAMNALTAAYSEREFSGSLFGVMLTAASLGGAAGPLLFGVVAERVGITAAFPLIAAVCLVGAVVFFLLDRV